MQSAQFRAVISAARGGDNSSSNTAAADAMNNFKDENGVPFGMVHCGNCGRNFSAESGERHIPKCRDIKAKPKALMRGGGAKR